MTALSKSLIAEKMHLESQWNSQYLVEGKETLAMKSIEEKIKRVVAKLKWRDLQNKESPIFIPSR